MILAWYYNTSYHCIHCAEKYFGAMLYDVRVYPIDKQGKLPLMILYLENYERCADCDCIIRRSKFYSNEA